MVPHVQHQVKEQLSNDSHATMATENTATFPAAEPPIGPAATAAGANPVTNVESVLPSGMSLVLQAQQKRQCKAQKSQAKGPVRKSRRVSGLVGEADIPTPEIPSASLTHGNESGNGKVKGHAN